LQTAIQAGVPITSEMNLFWKWNPAPVIGITGSNGKSTTTAMTHAIVSQFVKQRPGRRAWLGGNIGPACYLSSIRFSLMISSFSN